MADGQHRVVLALFLAAFCVSSLALKSDSDCPRFKDDEHDVIIKLCEDTCYYFHMTETLTFSESSSVCSGRGGTLIMPRSEEINDFLRKKILSFDTNEKTWVGMLQEKLTQVPKYFWMNGESLSSSLAESILEYADAFTVSHRNGVWHFDNSDKNVKNHFVCEIKGENIQNGNQNTMAPTVFPTKPDVRTTMKPTTMTSPTTTKMTTTPKDVITCPIINGDQSHMIRFGDICFFFELDEVKSYENAAKFCWSHGGYLALVKTLSIDLFLQQKLKNVFNRPKEAMWIGLHSDRDNSLPQFWDDGTSVTYTNFRYSFPIWDKYAMSSEDQWEAYPTGVRQHFICQLNATHSNSDLVS